MRRVRAIHVERTPDPAVLKWVSHDERLTTAPPGRKAVPATSRVRHLVDDGSIVDVSVWSGEVHVRAASPPAWRDLAPLVQAALIDELDALDAAADPAGHWLVARSSSTCDPPSLVEVQATVDRAAGAVTAAHGGAMTVVAVDGSTVTIEATGACDGCAQSDETVMSSIAPAIRAAHPAITDIELTAPVGGPGRWNVIAHRVRLRPHRSS